MAKTQVKRMPYRTYSGPVTYADSEAWLAADNTSEIKKRIQAILWAEAPITEHLLEKRLINSYGIVRNAVKIRGKLEGILKTMDLKVTADGQTPVYWHISQDPGSYSFFRTAENEESKRDVLDIPYREAANAALYVLRKQGAMSEEELKKQTSLLLGYKSMKGNVELMMDEAVKFAVREKIILTKHAKL